MGDRNGEIRLDLVLGNLIPFDHLDLFVDALQRIFKALPREDEHKAWLVGPPSQASL
jgi:hypothetical protein